MLADNTLIQFQSALRNTKQRTSMETFTVPRAPDTEGV